MTTEEIVLLFERAVRGIGSEDQVQRAIALVLTNRDVEYEREVSLSPASRIDFMVGTLGIEVKIGGGLSPAIRQLHRYAEFERVSELVLVTTRSSLSRVPAELNGKRIHVALLLGGLS